MSILIRFLFLLTFYNPSIASEIKHTWLAKDAPLEYESTMQVVRIGMGINNVEKRNARMGEIMTRALEKGDKKLVLGLLGQMEPISWWSWLWGTFLGKGFYIIDNSAFTKYFEVNDETSGANENQISMQSLLVQYNGTFNVRFGGKATPFQCPAIADSIE